MYDLKKSDAVIVAVKQANNGRRRPAESVEPRTAAEGNSGGQSTRRTQRRVSLSQAADRIRKAAKRNPEGCLTFRVPPTWVAIPKPDGGKRPLGSAKAVKDTLSVPTLSRSFSGYSYGLQRPWPDQRHFVITRGRSPVR